MDFMAPVANKHWKTDLSELGMQGLLDPSDGNSRQLMEEPYNKKYQVNIGWAACKSAMITMSLRYMAYGLLTDVVGKLLFLPFTEAKAKQ